MAMDSPIKRKAAASVLRPYMRVQGNDAAVGRGWRASAGNTYPVANFQAPGGVAAIIAQAKALNRFVFTRVFGRVN